MTFMTHLRNCNTKACLTEASSINSENNRK